MNKPTWKNTLNTDTASLEDFNIVEARSIALTLGYCYFLWEDRVYESKSGDVTAYFEDEAGDISCPSEPVEDMGEFFVTRPEVHHSVFKIIARTADEALELVRYGAGEEYSCEHHKTLDYGWRVENECGDIILDDGREW